MGAEYSLPQHPTPGMLQAQEDQRRMQTEPYASSAIYSELNFRV